MRIRDEGNGTYILTFIGGLGTWWHKLREYRWTKQKEPEN
jgi:hypothetical protein